jgi:tRNA(His) guanylyltransferase
MKTPTISKTKSSARMLKGLKIKGLHDLLFHHGVNLTKTPTWQRMGILIYKEPYKKQVENRAVTRRRIQENWSLPLFRSKEGHSLVQQILGWTKLGVEEEKIV